MSEEFLTRRQLREREKAGATVTGPSEVRSRRELRDRERAIQDRLDELNAQSQPIVVAIPEELIPSPISQQVYDVESVPTAEFVNQSDVVNPVKPFVDDANPGTIPTQIIKREVTTDTNSIVLPALPAITGSSFTVPESNIVIHTGSIDLPNQPSIATGEITLVTAPDPIVDATRAEEELATDTGMVGVVGIQPVAARSLPKRNKERVFPGRLRKGWGTVYLVLAVALVMIGIGALVFLLYTSKII